MTEAIQRALTTIELRESGLLAWGAVGAEWRHEELTQILAAHGDGEELLARLLDLALLVKTPSGGYRSRSAEIVRLLATLRQAFRSEAILQGRPLVLDYRLLQRPRRRPRRDIPVVHLSGVVAGKLGDAGRAALTTLAPPMLSAFQEASTVGVLDALSSSDPCGIVVTAGTGSGKTLSFYMPMIAWLCDQPVAKEKGVLALALYPRVELLKDQLRALTAYALKLAASPRIATPLSLATWFGPTPESAYAIRQGWAGEWRETSAGYVCPYLRCPSDDCEGDLVWPTAEIRAGTELLRCVSCGLEVPGTILRLTRESALANPARVMLSTTESLNRQLSSPANLRAFGISTRTLRAVLLDEVHTYEGTTGAQNAYLFRRLQKALGRAPIWAGLSATLANAGDFFARLVNLDPGSVTVIEPKPEDLEESGAEYLLALRHDPHGSTGTLSTTIQTAMLMSRGLDPMVYNPFNPGPESDGIFGKRLFAFTDKLDSTNRLYWDLLDAEGWAYPGTAKRNTSPLTLAHLRSDSQARLPVTQREPASTRDSLGQSWWLADHLGHEIDGDVQKRVGRTSSQDSGVSGDAEIIVATASLEVGFDDDRVGAIIQHKAPHDVAQFLQRKGRAGRNAATRPWTVVVLSDWGRDREAWDAYDLLFDPVVPPRSLPLDNMYVLRIQAVYSLLDWLAAELQLTKGSSWTESAGPADLLHPNNSSRRQESQRLQERMASVLTSLLRDGAERASLLRHLRSSLAVGRDSAADAILDKVLWEAPRPLLGVVVPTLRRRLMDAWVGERPTSDDASVRTRTPLRDFVPGNLFDELLVPDVEFHVPWARNETRIEHLPALRAIREFLPGNVSRHFGVWASNKRHWVAIPDKFDHTGATLIDVATMGGTPIDAVETPEGSVRIFAPTSVTLASVPDSVSDASSTRAEWQFSGQPLGSGTRLPLVHGVENVFGSLRAHLHSQGGGARIVRFATTGRGTIWMNGQSSEYRIRFVAAEGEQTTPAGIGVEIHADAIQGQVQIPVFDHPVTPLERTEWMRERIVKHIGLPDVVSSFDRDSLADAVEVVATSWHWTAGLPTESDFASELRMAAMRLGLTGPSSTSSVAGLVANPQVTGELRACLLAVRNSDRDESWIDWLKLRFTLTAADMLLAALAASNSRVDPDDLLVDLDSAVPGQFFISEQSPGGNGQIEALAADLIEHPQRLPVALANVMLPTDTELLDAELRSVVESDNSNVRVAIEQLARSWDSGHEAVRLATEEMDDALGRAGIVVGRAAHVALSTRFAGPGTSPSFVDEIQSWLGVRDNAEELSGFFASPRTHAALLAARAEADAHLHLSAPSETQRSRAIANVLWPRGAGETGSFNPYAERPAGSLDILRRYWREPVAVFEFSVWTEESRGAVHDLLRREGELILRVGSTNRAQLRKAILDLQTTPVEVGPLWCYPELLGIHSLGPAGDVRMVLREAW
jgi:hypothetical protein